MAWHLHQRIIRKLEQVVHGEITIRQAEHTLRSSWIHIELHQPLYIFHRDLRLDTYRADGSEITIHAHSDSLIHIQSHF